MRSLTAALIAVCLASCGKQPVPQNTVTAEQSSASADPSEEAGEGSGKLDRSHKGQSAPTVAFKDPTGRTVSLPQFEGKPLLVNLWATWCAPCVKELPTLDRLAGQLDGNVTVLTVSQDSSGRQKVDAFFAERSFEHLKPYLDADMGLLNTLKADTLPTTILYDADGRELWRVTGGENWEGPRAKALLAEVKS